MRRPVTSLALLLTALCFATPRAITKGSTVDCPNDDPICHNVSRRTTAPPGWRA